MATTQPRTAGVSGTAVLHPATVNAVSPEAAALLSQMIGQQAQAANATAPATVATATGGSKTPAPSLFQQLFGTDLTSALFFGVGLMVALLAIFLFYQAAAQAAARAAGPAVIRVADKAVSGAAKAAGTAAKAAAV